MRKLALSLSLAAVCAAPAFGADPAKINWSKIPAVTVPLFYPGVSSYEWLRSPEHKGAVEETKRGDACTACHDPGDERDDGAEIVKGGRLEPTPVKGKKGFIDLKVQAAYDANNAYLRFQWKTQAKQPGIAYPYYRYDGKEWKIYGRPRLDKSVREGKDPAIYEDRLSIMLDDGKVPGFAKQGCWLTCHDGERDMPKLATKDEIAANALLQAIKKRDVRKYLPESRTDPSDWKSGKSPEEIAKLKADGQFVDLMQWRAHRSNPMGYGDDGYVLEFRNFDQGKNAFASNMDGKTKQPRFMYDAKKAGARSVMKAQPGKGNFLVLDKTAAAFDPNAGWKAGEMLPRYVLQQPEGSAADNKASGTWKNGTWTVVFVRPLGLANADDKALKEGGVYNVGFAVHDDNITTRGHHVSWVRTLGIGVKADIQAVKLK